MKDTVVQQVRQARASIAADFDHDLGNFFAWAKAHTAAERKAKQLLPTQASIVQRTHQQTKAIVKKQKNPVTTSA
jgi:hypothetical protein